MLAGNCYKLYYTCVSSHVSFEERRSVKGFGADIAGQQRPASFRRSKAQVQRRF